MIIIETMTFNSGKEKIILNEYSSISVEITPNERALPYDMVISAFGKETIYKAFAPLNVQRIENKRTLFVPEIISVKQSEVKPFIAMIGLYEVLFVNFMNKSIQTALKMYRNQKDDQGFYKINVIPLDNDFLVVYEGGAARINEDGNLAWHQKLSWDDIFLKHDEKKLYYASEFNAWGDEWQIQIQDGAIINQGHFTA